MVRKELKLEGMKYHEVCTCRESYKIGSKGFQEQKQNISFKARSVSFTTSLVFYESFKEMQKLLEEWCNDYEKRKHQVLPLNF